MRHSKQSPHCELWQSPRCWSWRHKKIPRTVLPENIEKDVTAAAAPGVSVLVLLTDSILVWCRSSSEADKKKSLRRIIKTEKNIINHQLPGGHVNLLVPAGDPQHPETLIRPCPSTFWTVASHYRSIKTCPMRFDWLIDAFILNM